MSFWAETALKSAATVCFAAFALTLSLLYAMTFAAQLWEFGAFSWVLISIYTLAYIALMGASAKMYRIALQVIEKRADEAKG